MEVVLVRLWEGRTICLQKVKQYRQCLLSFQDSSLQYSSCDPVSIIHGLGLLVSRSQRVWLRETGSVLYRTDMKEERTEEVREDSSLLQRQSQYHTSFGASGGGQALQIPITAQQPCSFGQCHLCRDKIREGQSLVWIHT